MDFVQPRVLADALSVKAEQPAAVPIAGGTDVMVELNFDRRRPPALLDLTRVAELSTWDTDGPFLRIGAGVTYRRLIDELGPRLPGLARAARTVGSPQIRNRGTAGGNLGPPPPPRRAHPPPPPDGSVLHRGFVAGRLRVAGEHSSPGPKRSVLP